MQEWKKAVWMLFLFTLCPEKEDQTVLCNICYKTRVIWGKLIHSIPNKFAAKLYKRFPPHLSNVTTLPDQTWNAHCARATVKLLQKKKLKNLSCLSCVFQVCQIWIQLITICGKYCKRRCTKHASLIWSYQRCHWWMAAAMTHDPAWPTTFSVAVSIRSD